MPIPRSEVQSIISQIRAGNNEPALIASALQAMLDNPPYGAGYQEFLASVRSDGTNNPIVQVLKNDFGSNPLVGRIDAGDYRLAFNMSVNFNPSNTFVDILGSGAVQVETAVDTYVCQAGLVSSNEIFIGAYAWEPNTIHTPQDNLGTFWPVIIRIRKYQ